jgi:hypothetical protein
VRVTPPLGWSTWPITALPSGPARAGDLLGVARRCTAICSRYRWRIASSVIPARRPLHIHKQTLGYRIRRIEQLTGRVR